MFVRDKMVQSDVMRHNAVRVEGSGGLFMPQGEVWGSSSRNLFCKHKLWEGHFRAILKAPRKKAEKTFLKKIG